MCLNLAGKKAKSELIYSLTTRDFIEPAHLYVHIPPCLASSRSIKQTGNLKREDVYTEAYTEETTTPASGWFHPSLSPKAEQAGLRISDSDFPAEPVAVLGGLQPLHIWKGVPLGRPPRLQPSVQDPPGAQTHSSAARPCWLESGKAQPPPQAAQPTTVSMDYLS